MQMRNFKALKLLKNKYRISMRQNFFSIRVVNEWSKLPQPQVVTDTSSVNAFKTD